MKKKGLYIVGTKTLADMVIELASHCNYTIAGFFDDTSKEKTYMNRPIIGPTALFLSHPSNYTHASFVVAIGNNDGRARICNNIIKANLAMPPLIHPSATVMPTSVIEAGSILFAHSYVGTQVTIGKGNLIFPHVVLTHHSKVEDYNFFAPGVTVGGHTKIGSLVKIGMNSVIAANQTLKNSFSCLPLTYVNK